MSERRAAWHYDGRTAQRHQVEASIEDGRLVLWPDGEGAPVGRLFAIGDRGADIWGWRDREGWRVGFVDPLPPSWRAALPRQEHHGGALDRFGVVPTLIVGALLGLLGIIGFWKGAVIAAHLVPERWEVAFGDTLAGDFGGEACATPAGQAALDRLATRLASDGRPVTVRVIDLDMVNAVALPGRRVAIFSGLLEEARSADEIAGVLGHEIGHVENRDVMASLIRDFGISLLLGGADGGAVAQGLLASRYSRAAERGADAAAIEGLRRIDASPADTAAFFQRLGKMESELGRAGVLLNYVASHPLSADRRRMFAASAVKGHRYAPAMDAAEWRAVKGMCGVEKRRPLRGRAPSGQRPVSVA